MVCMSLQSNGWVNWPRQRALSHSSLRRLATVISSGKTVSIGFPFAKDVCGWKDKYSWRNHRRIDSGFETLRLCLSRRVKYIFVLTLSGTSYRFDSIKDAVRFVSEHDQSAPVSDFVRYELNIRYSNEDEVRGTFQKKERAIEFLRSFET